MKTRGFVGFYSEGVTKGVIHRTNAELKNLGLHVINFLTRIDYDSMEKRAKHYMQQATPDADISSVWYTIPATTAAEQQRLLDNDPAAYEKLEMHQDGEVNHCWSEMKIYLASNEPVTAYKVYKDYSQELYGYGSCNYAYILNFDTQELEIYEGNNHDPHQGGRYVRAKEEIFAQANEGFQEEIEQWLRKGALREEAEQVVPKNFGVRLILSMPLSLLREMEDEERKKFVNLFHQLLTMQAERRDCEYASTCSKLNEKYAYEKEGVGDRFTSCSIVKAHD